MKIWEVALLVFAAFGVRGMFEDKSWDSVHKVQDDLAENDGTALAHVKRGLAWFAFPAICAGQGVLAAASDAERGYHWVAERTGNKKSHTVEEDMAKVEEQLGKTVAACEEAEKKAAEVEAVLECTLDEVETAQAQA